MDTLAGPAESSGRAELEKGDETSMGVRISIEVNGETHEREVEPRQLL
jgi:hypothetical protein